MKKDQDSRTSPIMRGLALLSITAGILLGYSGAGVALGYLAWSKLGWPWWVLLLSSVLGLGLAFYRLYQFSKRDFS